MTDGRSRDKNDTLDAAERLRGSSIDSIYAIGIGDPDDLDADELQAIASSQDNVFNVTNFDALDDIQDSLRMKTCENTSRSNQFKFQFQFLSKNFKP